MCQGRSLIDIKLGEEDELDRFFLDGLLCLYHPLGVYVHTGL